MPGPNVSSVFADFNHHVRQSSLLLESARARGIPFFQLEQIAELSFLRLHLAWERFLEESFARYMCGARSITGFRPRCYATPRNRKHARRFLMMGLQRIPRYADWAKRELVIWRANTVFKDGRPFASPLRAGARDLDDMATIRNCIAHSSEYARSSSRSWFIEGSASLTRLERVDSSYDVRPMRPTISVVFLRTNSSGRRANSTLAAGSGELAPNSAGRNLGEQKPPPYGPRLGCLLNWE